MQDDVKREGAIDIILELTLAIGWLRIFEAIFASASSDKAEIVHVSSSYSIAASVKYDTMSEYAGEVRLLSHQ